jgi:DNA-3-methyladenine glycosylase I
MLKRCDWCGTDELYQEYHDKEWGVPVRDDATMFEFLMLETFQAGLSWITILRKRENFRKAFDNFDYKKIAKYSEAKVESLLLDEGIIRHRKKIEAAISNARAYMIIQKEFGTFCKYFWAFTNNEVILNKCEVMADIVSQTELSQTISKDLKKWGFKFVGPTVIYAHMQATGMVNDHIVSCQRYKEVQK